LNPEHPESKVRILSNALAPYSSTVCDEAGFFWFISQKNTLHHTKLENKHTNSIIVAIFFL
jgi:hypothetical protein